MIDVRITTDVLDINDSYRRVAAPESGGVSMFIGSVRLQTDGRSVRYLEFEAYDKMAIREMKKIAEAARRKWDVHTVLVHHRIGHLEVGEIPVIIAVAAARRNGAIKAARYIIDELKATVPIWKKEVFADGESWVIPHP